MLLGSSHMRQRKAERINSARVVLDTASIRQRKVQMHNNFKNGTIEMSQISQRKDQVFQFRMEGIGQSQD